MLSYQHGYHAGNLADVHKHGLLAWMLDYLGRKAKPYSYIETHGGRALYDLSAPEAVKTGEAAQGIGRALDWFDAGHPYLRVLEAVRAEFGSAAYAGSPLLAERLARAGDRLSVAEMHPGEAAALRRALPDVRVHEGDGFAMAHALVPPEPRRGLMLVDPSYEIKEDYKAIPKHVGKWVRAWNVGVIVIWYPVLTSCLHAPMLEALQRFEGLRLEVAFPPARPGHGMVGSGLFVINPPFGLADEAERLKHHFDGLKGEPA
jgi:23S rRNA (adenine2030-N6)-methyltransferase